MPEDQNIPQRNSKDQNSQAEANGNIMPAGEVASQEETIEPSNLNLAPQTSNMEVHHHPNLHHTGKHWKEYFLEFLMIFLAVTLWFFAENIRSIGR